MMEVVQIIDQLWLNDINFQWNSTDKNLSISRKLDTAPLHKVSFCIR